MKKQKVTGRLEIIGDTDRHDCINSITAITGEYRDTDITACMEITGDTNITTLRSTTGITGDLLESLETLTSLHGDPLESLEIYTDITTGHHFIEIHWNHWSH